MPRHYLAQPPYGYYSGFVGDVFRHTGQWQNKYGDGCAEREWRRDCHVKTRFWRYDFRFLFMYKYTFRRFGICILKIRKIESVECHSLVRLAEELFLKGDLEPSEGLYYSFYSLYRLLLSVRTYSFVS